MTELRMSLPTSLLPLVDSGTACSVCGGMRVRSPLDVRRGLGPDYLAAGESSRVRPSGRMLPSQE